MFCHKIVFQSFENTFFGFLSSPPCLAFVFYIILFVPGLSLGCLEYGGELEHGLLLAADVILGLVVQNLTPNRISV